MSFSRDDDARNGRDDAYRRRSPGPNRRARGDRLRSRSPLGIDRYQPGDRGRRSSATYDRDQYRRRSPLPIPSGNIDRYVPGHDTPGPVINPIPHPLTLDYQVGFSWFAEWWRKEQEVKEEKERQKRGERRPPTRLRGDQEVREDREKERDKIQEAFDDYKHKFQAQTCRNFVTAHKDQQWFKEYYDPDVRDPIRERQFAFNKSNYGPWEADLDAGVFDDFTLEGIYKNDSNGAGGVLEKEEGEAAAANEVLGVSDLVPSKGGDLRDEAVFQPALLLKTIAPNVSREKVENLCRDQLGEGEGGFKWLSLSDPNPLKKFHRIGWVMLHPGGDQVLETSDKERGDGRGEEEEEEEEEEAAEDPEDKMDTAAEPVVRSGTDVALEAINGKSIEDEAGGAFTCHVGIHVPQSAPKKRALWDLFSAPERIDRDLELATRLVTKLEMDLGYDLNAINKIEERVEGLRSQGLLQPYTNGTANKPGTSADKDSNDLEDGEMEDEGVNDDDDDVDDEDLTARKKKLDLVVEYLRRVHHFCLFCVSQSDSIHELARKCPGGHLRRPRASLTSSSKATAKASAYGEPFPLSRKSEVDHETTEENSSTNQKQRFNKNNRTHVQLQRAFNWVKTYEDKLYQILEPVSVDLKKLGGKPVDEALEEELKKFFKHEDDTKIRCKVPECKKMFKSENFWRSHAEKRHPEWFRSQKKTLEIVNNYILDPGHITVPTHRIESSGQIHYATNAMIPPGSSRGFNAAAVGYQGPMIPPGSLPVNFGQYPIVLPQPLYGNNAGFPMMANQSGPMRRAGGKFGARTNGPYERGGRNGKFGGARAASGTSAREPITGRAIKSYEDLDAVAPGESDKVELDY